MPISAPLAEGLAARRDAINARVARARLRRPGFDTDRFAAFLREGVDPVVQAVAQVRPERVAEVTEALTGIAIDLIGQEREQAPHLRVLWRELLPQLVHLVALQPQATAGALSNAVLEIGRWPEARPAQWCARLGVVASQLVDLQTLRCLGQLLAWQAGMAHFRRPALRVAADLPQELAVAALDLPPGTDWPHWCEAALADPWLRQDREVNPGFHRLGAFSGFGGVFTQPPLPRPFDDGFLVRSGTRHFQLHADRFGATLLPAEADDWQAAPESVDQELPASLSTRVPWQVPASRTVVAGNTRVIFSPWTHALAVGPVEV